MLGASTYTMCMLLWTLGVARWLLLLLQSGRVGRRHVTHVYSLCVRGYLL